jgi:hypothetical protein
VTAAGLAAPVISKCNVRNRMLVSSDIRPRLSSNPTAVVLWKRTCFRCMSRSLPALQSLQIEGQYPEPTSSDCQGENL